MVFAFNPSDFQSLYQPEGMKTRWIQGQQFMRINNTNANLTRWKIFVPPGTKSLSVLGHVGQGQALTYKFIARFGQPPMATDVPAGELSNSGFSLKQLLSGDCFGQNSSGYLFIVSAAGILTTDGRWLYVDFKGGTAPLKDVQVNDEVDIPKYTDWYNNYAVWQPNGDPIEGGIPPAPTTPPQPTVTPTPAPTPTGDVVIKIVPGQRYIFY